MLIARVTHAQKICKKLSTKTRAPRFGNFAFSFSRQFARHQIDTADAQCITAATEKQECRMPTSKTKTTKKPAAKVVVMPAPMATAPMPAAVVAPVAPVSNVIPMPKKPVAKKPVAKAPVKAAAKKPVVKASVKKPTAKKPVAKKPVAKAPVKMKVAAAAMRPAKKVARKKK
jgi:outer membrane biosynthesis protein TonB